MKSYGYSLKKAFYNFVSKEELLRINREFLNHNYHTDIISFDYTNSKIIEADFYLSMWALILIVGLNFEFVLEELDRIDTWGKSIFIIIAIAYLINLFIQFPKFIKNFGGCTIRYEFHVDGTKDAKIFDTYLEK